MFISQRGLKVITDFEGLNLKPYYCSGGYLTVGWGHRTSSYDEITYDHAQLLLLYDLQKVAKAIKRLIKVPLAQGQYDALASFTFNLGSGALQRSTLRMKLNRGEYRDASFEFPKWCKTSGRIIRGLLRRRLAEQKMFLGG